MPTRPDTVHATATRRAMWRLLPLLGLAYFMSYVDRTNIALAKTRLEADIGVGAAAYGLGAGIFFVSYALLEVPSNMVLYRVGARTWIARIAVSWGLVSAAMMFVQGEVSFYVLRFVLGAAEAGLYPALMFTVTLWFAQRHRVPVVGLVYTAPALATILGAPAGGGLMGLDGAAGLKGWQWMFLVEGLITVVVGLVVWRVLPSRPEDARWLTPEQAAALTEQAAADAHPSPHRLRGNLRQAFARPVVLALAATYFVNQLVSSAVGFNLPSIVEDLGVSGSMNIGLVTGSMGVGILAGVLFFPWLRGRIGQDTALIVGCALAGTAVLGGFLAVDAAGARFALLFGANFFLMGTLPLFWSVAMSRMSGLMAAVGLAFINTVGLLGGFVGPLVFGLVEDRSDTTDGPFVLVVIAGLLGTLLAGVLKWIVDREDPAPLAAVPATAD
ncbi:MFS transporter [Streptomyces sp. SID5785]|uniref:MFS transporter n=1 Tax=Streptomyces sp. SID5785 TaxID=2690309 RepID=UPI001361C268|nr:MFS transporter [Streptomyces sp. SID5785]MZD06065.1 MFS transporter [Streptomyces sp. SID5785]